MQEPARFPGVLAAALNGAPVIGEISNKTRSRNHPASPVGTYSRARAPPEDGFDGCLQWRGAEERNVPIKMQRAALLRASAFRSVCAPPREWARGLRFNAPLARRVARETLRESGCEISITSGPTIPTRSFFSRVRSLGNFYGVRAKAEGWSGSVTFFFLDGDTRRSMELNSAIVFRT